MSFLGNLDIRVSLWLWFMGPAHDNCGSQTYCNFRPFGLSVSFLSFLEVVLKKSWQFHGAQRYFIPAMSVPVEILCCILLIDSQSSGISSMGSSLNPGSLVPPSPTAEQLAEGCAAVCAPSPCTSVGKSPNSVSHKFNACFYTQKITFVNKAKISLHLTVWKTRY